MFKKLISNLPFNPSLIGDVAFYAKRLHGETAIRRGGLIFVVMALLVQMFAVISPPQSTSAASSNDIVRGGFSSRTQAVNYCRSNTGNFADILAYYGVSCDIVASASTQNVSSTSYNKQLDSLGRNPQGPVIARTGKPTNEYAVSIQGKRYYMRNLWAWDTYASSNYKMLVMKNNRGQTIMIMYNCGNIVTVGVYKPPPPPPVDYCPNIPGVQPAGTKCDACPNIPGTQNPGTKCDACPNKPGVQSPGQSCDVCPNIPGTQLTNQECDVCPNLPGTQSNRNECYPCPEAEEDDSITACLELAKTAANITQDIDNANGTKAAAGDVIEYSLHTKNNGSQTVRDFVVEENMADVLEYANVVDLHGGTMNDESIVSWPKTDIAARSTITKKITVKVKNPIPQTPTSSSDPGSNDLTMTNVYYGTAVNITLPAAPVKQIEVVTQTLPQTGPGTTIAVGFAVTVFASYFFARSRLVAKELDIVRADFATSGGS